MRLHQKNFITNQRSSSKQIVCQVFWSVTCRNGLMCAFSVGRMLTCTLNPLIKLGNDLDVWKRSVLKAGCEDHGGRINLPCLLVDSWECNAFNAICIVVVLQMRIRLFLFVFVRLLVCCNSQLLDIRSKTFFQTFLFFIK